MSKYELIALDMDGTLLNSHLEISEKNREAIRRASAAGKQVALCTGRCMSEIRDLLPQIPEVRYVICENGGCVYDLKYERSLAMDSLPNAEVNNILRLMKHEHAIVQCFHDNQSYVYAPDDRWLEEFDMADYRESFATSTVYDAYLFDTFEQHPFTVEKMDLYFTNDADRARIDNLLSERPLQSIPSMRHLLEIVPLTADKGRGLERLCAHLDISAAQAIGVGDSLNDAEMLRAAGLGVAMGNACDEIKRLAGYITADCDHDGVAQAIDEFLLCRLQRPLKYVIINQNTQR